MRTSNVWMLVVVFMVIKPQGNGRWFGHIMRVETITFPKFKLKYSSEEGLCAKERRERVTCGKDQFFGVIVCRNMA